MKLREIRLSRGLKAKEITTRCGTDESGWSKIENYKFLPIPGMLNAICRELEVAPLDIYERGEITLVPAPSSSNKGKAQGRGYNLCIFIPEAYRDKLVKWIKELGFHTFQEWLMPYIKETERNIANRHS